VIVNVDNINVADADADSAAANAPSESTTTDVDYSRKKETSATQQGPILRTYISAENLLDKLSA
jgi:hypothetical protein